MLSVQVEKQAVNIRVDKLSRDFFQLEVCRCFLRLFMWDSEIKVQLHHHSFFSASHLHSDFVNRAALLSLTFTLPHTHTHTNWWHISGEPGFSVSSLSSLGHHPHAAFVRLLTDWLTLEKQFLCVFAAGLVFSHFVFFQSTKYVNYLVVPKPLKTDFVFGLWWKTS